MAALPYNDLRTRFGAHALDYVFIHERLLQRVTGEDLERLAQIVRESEALLSKAESATATADPEFRALIEKVRALRSGVARVLAVAGPDESWSQEVQETITLTERESIEVVQALLEPPEPNERLRAAFKDYKAFVGL